MGWVNKLTIINGCGLRYVTEDIHGGNGCWPLNVASPAGRKKYRASHFGSTTNRLFHGLQTRDLTHFVLSTALAVIGCIKNYGKGYYGRDKHRKPGCIEPVRPNTGKDYSS